MVIKQITFSKCVNNYFWNIFSSVFKSHGKKSKQYGKNAARFQAAFFKCKRQSAKCKVSG